MYGCLTSHTPPDRRECSMCARTPAELLFCTPCAGHKPIFPSVLPVPWHSHLQTLPEPGVLYHGTLVEVQYTCISPGGSLATSLRPKKGRGWQGGWRRRPRCGAPVHAPLPADARSWRLKLPSMAAPAHGSDGAAFCVLCRALLRLLRRLRLRPAHQFNSHSQSLRAVPVCAARFFSS